MNTEAPISLSIVTVCFNDLPNLQRTVESIDSQAARGNWEHILIDGASEDGSADWYRSAGFDFPHRIVSEPDKGIFDAMNKSLAIANGEYVIFMNAGDCFADVGVIGRVLQRITTGPNWGYSKARMVDSCGNNVRPMVGRIPFRRLVHLFGIGIICHQTVVMQLRFLRLLGGFDLQMGHAADYHLLVRAASISPPATWDDVDVNYLVGGVSDKEIYRGLWLGHRCRVDALAMSPTSAHVDAAWTAVQVVNVRLRKTLKPIFGKLYLRLRQGAGIP